MVIVDANVLLYAVNDSTSQHAGAKRWLEQALSGREAVGFPWVVLLAFLRLATLPAVFSSPLNAEDAFDVIDQWLTAGPAIVVQPTARHASLLRNLLAEAGTAGNLVSDAHLATLALEHGAAICSFDRDFNRFPGLKVVVPG